jgi:hypothetical protein
MLKTSTPTKSVLAGSGLTQLLQEACKDPLTAGRSIYNKISGSTATRHLSARSTRSLPAKTICNLLRRLQLIPANRTRSNDRLPGQTFVGGATIQSSLKSNLYAPGYQYDTIRRKRGHLGLGVHVDLFAASAKISATPQTVNGGQSETASAWLLAPIPVGGPEFRLYLTNSPTFCGRQRLRDVLRRVRKLYLDGRYGWVDSNQAPQR